MKLLSSLILACLFILPYEFLTAQTINSFPYYIDFNEYTPENTGEGTTNIQGWKTLAWDYKGKSAMLAKEDIGGYYLNFNITSTAKLPNYIISPALDLSSLQNPCLSFVTTQNYLTIYVSKSGTEENDFISVSTNRIFYTDNLELDKDVKYIKFSVDNNSYTRGRQFYLNNISIYDNNTNTISNFPWNTSFESTFSLIGWSGNYFFLSTADESEKNNIDGINLIRFGRTGSSAYINTPEFDLSGMKHPYLSYMANGNGVGVSYSEDGSRFYTINAGSFPTGFSKALKLPLQAKYLRFTNSNAGSYLDNILIKDAWAANPMDELTTIVNYGMLRWIPENNTYKLKPGENHNADGIAELIFSNPELSVLPSGSYYSLRFTVKGLDRNKVTFRINNTTYNTDGTFDLNLGVNSDYTITATLIAGTQLAEIPAIILSDINLTKSLAAFPHTGLFYDIDGDGIKEFFKPLADRNSSTHLVSYKYLDGAYHIQDTIISYFTENSTQTRFAGNASIFNINNDGYPDFGIPLVSPENLFGIYISNSGYNYTKIEDVQAQQWDANNDGRPDLYSLPDISDRNSRYLHIQNADGSFTKTKMDVTSYSSLSDSIIYEHWGKLGSGGPFDPSGIPSLSDGMFIRDGINYTSLDYLSVEIDLNKDGLPDLVDLEKGGILYNLGDNLYVTGQYSGQITAKDLNGDFITDFIIYDDNAKTVTTVIYEGAGNFREQVLIKNLSITDIYCYDFDKDGDMDILLTFDYTTQSGYAYLVLCENDGKGNFKIHENYFTEEFLFKACADIDNDGYYDVIAVRGSDITADNNVYMFKGKSGMKFETPVAITYYTYWNTVFELQDFTNNGVFDLAMTTSNNTVIYSFEDIIHNSAPQKMSAPRYTIDRQSGTIRILWDAGKDKETSSVDLTYALRIGTQPGKGDIFDGNADNNGLRYSFTPGNMGGNLDKIFNINGWAPGNYYIAVQAVDPMFKGSAWSDETVYTHSLLSSEFYVSMKEFSTADTITITLAGAAVSGYEYEWNLDGGKIIGTNADKSVLSAVFEQEGKKIISLQVSDGKGNYAPSFETELTVRHGKFQVNKYGELGTSYIFAYDMDGDGTTELITYNGIYIHEKDYDYIKLPKVYNSDLQAGNTTVIDFNMNGMADIISNTNKGNILLNQDDLNFEFKEENFTLISKNGNTDISTINPFNRKNFTGFNGVLDFNNDGYLDLYRNGEVYLNQRDNLTFIQSGTTINRFLGFADLNNDGYFDFISLSETYPRTLTININKGDFTFDSYETSHIIDNNYNIFVKDLNNDGFPEIFLYKNERTIAVFVGSRQLDYKETFDINLSLGDYELRGITDVKDYDNNGYLDIWLNIYKNGMSYSGILYFYPDFVTKLSIPNLPDNSPETYVDLNNDGIPDYLTMNGSYIYKHFTTISNTAPETPKNLRAAQTDNGLLIKWDHAYDAETPYTHMRYNLSVKKKGVTGNNSFIISPLNGLKNNALPIADYPYIERNQYEIPAEVLPAGEYEIQVQSIDLWNAHSPMSEVITIETTANLSIQLPLEACIDEPVEINYRGTEPTTGNFSWDWDNATVLSGSGSGPYMVKWAEPGVKTIKISTNGISSSSNILISKGDALNLDFSLPEYGLAGTEVFFELPLIAMDTDAEYYFEKSDSRISISRKTGTREARAIFPAEGKHWIEFNVETGTCGAVSHRESIEIKAALPTPQISIVTIDETTGKNKISWNESNINLTSEITEVMVYKEGNRYNQFNLIGTADPKTGYFIDYTSNPQITTSRYRLTLNSIYNAESNAGIPHKSTHLLLNKGMGGAINLVWTVYEGGIIESYRIYRGTSEDNMTLLTEVPGSTNTYTDLTPPEGLFYYAIEYDHLYNDDWSEIIRNNSTRSTSIKSGRSNLVSIVNAQNISFIESINILAVEEEIKLTPEQKELHLYTEVMPVLADYKNVNWLIVEGEHLAYVNSRGLLTVSGLGNGSVKIRAVAIDGSNIYKDFSIPVSGFSSHSIESITEEPEEIVLYPNPVKETLFIKNLDPIHKSLNATIFNLQGQVISNSKPELNRNEINIPVGHLPPNIYFIRISSDSYSITKSFIKK